MNDKAYFVEKLKKRTMRFVVSIVHFYSRLKSSDVGCIIGKQLVRSACSTSANYRAACISRSKRDFFSKMSIVVEEADETYFWLDLLKEAGIAKKEELDPLIQESLEILKIMSKARSNVSF